MKTDKKTLALTAAKARLLAVQMVYEAASGHPGGSLSCLDVLTALYFNEMKIDPANPRDPERDRFVMSKGHCSPAVYPTLALRGFFPVEELKMFRRIDGHMSGHVEMKHVPGVDMSTGSLGQGVSTAVGMALAAKHTGKANRVYSLLGDGEIQEGQVWEACMFASHYSLDNLVVIVDNNGLQIDGNVANVMSPYPIVGKLEAFGFKVEAVVSNFDFTEADEKRDERNTSLFIDFKSPQAQLLVICGFIAVVKLFTNCITAVSTCTAIPRAAFTMTPK